MTGDFNQPSKRIWSIRDPVESNLTLLDKENYILVNG